LAARPRVREHAPAEPELHVLARDEVDHAAGAARVVARRGIVDHLDAGEQIGGELLEKDRQRVAAHGRLAPVDVDGDRAVPERDPAVDVHLQLRDGGEGLADG
jgi:hypothetical protein